MFFTWKNIVSQACDIKTFNWHSIAWKTNLGFYCQKNVQLFYLHEIAKFKGEEKRSAKGRNKTSEHIRICACPKPTLFSFSAFGGATDNLVIILNLGELFTMDMGIERAFLLSEILEWISSLSLSRFRICASKNYPQKITSTPKRNEFEFLRGGVGYSHSARVCWMEQLGFSPQS